MNAQTFFAGVPKEDIIAAVLTSTIISHSYEVETTRDIVTTWNTMRDKIELPDDRSTISAILANGRLLDIEEDIKNPDRINNIISSISYRLPPDLIIDNSIVMSAILTSAYVAKSQEIETTKYIVENYYQIKDKISSYFTDIPDDSPQIAALLSWGRLLELKGNITNIQSVVDTLDFIMKEIRTKNVGHATYNDFGSAFITAAYVQISPKIERIKDIVETWDRNRYELEVNDQCRYVSTILASGKIKDANATELSQASGAREILDQIHGLMRAVY